MNDVMNDNMAAFAHVGARLGAFFLLDQMFRKQCTVQQYTTLIYYYYYYMCLIMLHKSLGGRKES